MRRSSLTTQYANRTTRRTQATLAAKANKQHTCYNTLSLRQQRRPTTVIIFSSQTVSQQIVKSNGISTFPEVLFNLLWSFEVFAAKTTAKLFHVRVYDLMLSQFS